MNTRKIAKLSLVILLILFLSGLSIHTFAYELSMTLSGQKVDFGTVSPKDPPVVIPHVTQMAVVSTGGSWQLSVQANGDFVTTPDPTYSFPVSRLSWALHPATTPQWTPFSTSETTVTTGDVTPATGEVVDLDYKLDIANSDPASTMTYQTTITYTVSPGNLDTSYAEPNPFNPNTETTTIHYLLDAETNVSIEILDANEAHVRTLSPSPANPQAAGSQSVVWDGENDSGVIVADGQYKYLIQDESDNVIASGVIVVDTGTATVQGTVTDTDSNPVSRATVTLLKSDGTQMGSTTSAADGSYDFTTVTEGYYYLKVERYNYYPETTDVFFVERGRTITKDIQLMHNRSLLLTKKADTNVAAIGDIIKYKLNLQNVGIGDANEVRIEDQLPPGFTYINGTSEISDKGPLEPTKSGDRLIWQVGGLKEDETATLTYMVAVGFETELGDRTNRAFTFGKVSGEKVSDGPASAAVRIRGGLFRKEGTIIGKVFFDKNGNNIQDQGEKGVSEVEIALDDGTHVITDDFGRYSIPSVRPGSHTLKVIKTPTDYQVKSEKFKLVEVPVSGLVKTNFPLKTGKSEEPGPVTITGVAGVEAGFKDIKSGKTYIDPSLRFYMNGKSNGLSSTMTFDLDRKRGDKILNRSAKNLYYPIYGDGSTFTKEARPAGKVYFNLKQDSSYLRYGRYNTGLNEGEFTKYTRNLPGTKVQLKADGVSFTAFHSRTRQVAGKDELEGADSPGPYHLTHAPIVPGSESVRIIVRDKDDPTQIIKVDKKKPGKDYTINPTTGNITFVKPIPSEYLDGNPVFIVVNYEFIPVDTGSKYSIIGGREEISISDTLQIGATYIRESQSPEDYSLGGLDATLNSGILSLKTEVTGSTDTLYKLSGSPGINTALKSSLTLNPKVGNYKIYYRRIEPEFTNPIHPISPKDIEKWGLKISRKMGTFMNLSWKTAISHDNVLSNPHKVTHTTLTPVDLTLDSSFPKLPPMTFKYNLKRKFDDLTPHKLNTRTDTASLKVKQDFGQIDFTIVLDLKRFEDLTQTDSGTLSYGISSKATYSPLDILKVTGKQGLDLSLDTSIGEITDKTATSQIGLDLSLSNFSASVKYTRKMDLINNTSSSSISGTTTLKWDPNLIENLDTSLEIKLDPFAANWYKSSTLTYKGSITKTHSLHGKIKNTPGKTSLTLNLDTNLEQSFFKHSKFEATWGESGNNKKYSLSTDLAFRPLRSDRLNLLAKFKMDGPGNIFAPHRALSLEASYEIASGLSLTGKLAYKRKTKGEAISETGLLMGRAKYELTKKFNLIGESRFYLQSVNKGLNAQSTIELGYRLLENLRLSLGYNFTGSNFGWEDSLSGGPFIKITCPM